MAEAPETSLGGGGGFFGGLASGIGAGTSQVAARKKQEDENALGVQKQAALEQNTAKTQAVAQIDATIKHIQDVIKANADAGNDPKSVVPAIQPLIQSAQGIAQAAGIDPARISATVQTMLARPAVADTTKHSLTRVTGGMGEPDIVLQHEQSTGKVVRIDPKTGQPMLSDAEIITPRQAATANPAPVSAAPSNRPDVPVQPASMGAPVIPAQQPAQPAAPALPPDMKPGPDAINYAIKNNIVGPGFLQAVPEPYRNTVTGLVDYKVNPDALSKRRDKGTGQSEYTQYLSWAHQFTHGEYDPKYYKPMQAAIKEFTSGGQTSPAGQITVGNTALAHGGQVADAIDKLKAVPGLFQKMEKSDTPFVSYAAAALKNQSIRGTSEGAALSAFLTASHHFVDETTKFYAGGQPAEAGRARGLENFNGAKSEAELYQALNSEAELLHGKVNALQDRWKTAIAGPRMGDILFRNAIPDFPVLSQGSEIALDRIGQGYLKATSKGGAAPSANSVVDFRTYFGTK